MTGEAEVEVPEDAGIGEKDLDFFADLDPDIAKALDDPKLTPQQKRFCLEYDACMVGKTAAARSGYSVKNAGIVANYLLRKAHVAACIMRLQSIRGKKLGLDGTYVVSQLHLLYLRCVAKGDEKTAIKALENLGKHLGIYEADNRQRTGTESLDEIKARLKERGFDLDKVAARSEN